MLHPSPEIQKRLEKYQTIDPIEAKAIKQERRRAKLIHGIGHALNTLAITGAFTGLYAADVHSNQEVQATAIITVEDFGNPLHSKNNDSALVFIDGFGSVDATSLTHYMAPAIQPIKDGRLWSVGYNDAPLKYENIADKIIEKADKEGVTSLMFIDQSGGGNVGAKVKERIREKTNISIAASVDMFMPDGVEGLQPDHQVQMELAKNISKVPGAMYSTPLRYLGEMAFRSDNYTNGSFWDNLGNLVTTSNDVHNSITEKKLPGTWLMVDQMLQIENADIKTRVENLAKEPLDVVRTPEIYIGTDNDPVVDDDKSVKAISEYYRKAHIPFKYIKIPGLVHGQPGINNEAIVKRLAEEKNDIQAIILAQQEEADSHKLVVNRVLGLPQ